MAYSDLHFNNIQLMKLVSSAELLFQHLYELVSADNKGFIDQWFCFKQEFDETRTSITQFDVNENVPEASVLARIDEVSESEKVSPVSSASTESRPNAETDQLNENINTFPSKDDTSSTPTDGVPDQDAADLSELDSDLLDYMTDFKLLTDCKMSDWFKTFCVNVSEIKQYINWLESKDYEDMWTDNHPAVRDKIHPNSFKFDGYEDPMNKIEFDVSGIVIPVDASHQETNRTTAEVNTLIRNPISYANNFPHYNYQYGSHQEELIDQQIRYLQDIRKILFCIKQDCNKKFRNKNELHSSAERHSVLKIDVAFEIIDLSIEMKNQMKLGRDIQDFLTLDDKVDTIINDSLRVLTMNEIRHLLYTYLNNVTTMRKCGLEHDKQVSELDREISNQKFLIWRLYMIINENKQPSYDSRCLTMHQELEQKLQMMGKTITDESNDESIAGIRGRALLPIMEKSSLHDSSQSESRESQNAMACVPHIPEKSLKILQSSSASSLSTRVTRDKTKLLIRPQKH